VKPQVGESVVGVAIGDVNQIGRRYIAVVNVWRVFGTESRDVLIGDKYWGCWRRVS